MSLIHCAYKALENPMENWFQSFKTMCKHYILQWIATNWGNIQYKGASKGAWNAGKVYTQFIIHWPGLRLLVALASHLHSHLIVLYVHFIRDVRMVKWQGSFHNDCLDLPRRYVGVVVSGLWPYSNGNRLCCVCINRNIFMPVIIAMATRHNGMEQLRRGRRCVYHAAAVLPLKFIDIIWMMWC